MKSFLIFMVALLSSASITFAQSEALPIPTPSEVPTPPERDRAITLRPQTQTRIINLAANISNRLDAYINRLQNIATRLSSRLDKLQATGVEVTTARASLGRAQTALDAAKSDMAGIDQAVAAVSGSNEPVRAWREVRVRFLSARDNIRVAFTELRTVMTDIREALAAPPTAPATTTTEITN